MKALRVVMITFSEIRVILTSKRKADEGARERYDGNQISKNEKYTHKKKVKKIICEYLPLPFLLVSHFYPSEEFSGPFFVWYINIWDEELSPLSDGIFNFLQIFQHPSISFQGYHMRF
eukprot:TRINITY_DN7455_c0_g2_i1.p1 TRINITY_DN7455_c0_g2~~TRINITY_DN7455_c0_g2_i1.p1  ORF type:complete len:118 (-),score=19.16 TRINITY_DN7455_c0_g2_i1:524-877(-)